MRDALQRIGLPWIVVVMLVVLCCIGLAMLSLGVWWFVNTPEPAVPTPIPGLTIRPSPSLPSSITVSPSPMIMCSPPPCRADEAYYCSDTCPGGCGTGCATHTPQP